MIDRRFKHGLVPRKGKPPEFNVWYKMLRRCRDPRVPEYKNYGARGIKVCERWNSFAAFLSDMGRRPSPDHTIERVDNDAGYCPTNCIWATRDVQARNRRKRTRPTHCAKGHELSGDNLYARPDGKNGCRACRHQNMVAFYKRKRSVAA